MVAALLALALLAPLGTQDPEPAPPERGWALSNESGALHWTSRAAQAAFVLAPGEALDPRSAAGAGAATWDGLIELVRLGQYSFEAQASGGSAKLELFGADGKPLAQPIDGRAGSVRAHLRFDPPGGAARLQLRWKLADSPQGDFDWQPVPARVVSIPPELAQAVREGELALRGRVLLEQKGCTNCHLPSDAMAQSVGRRKAPKLPSPGFGKAWVARWIADPASVRAGADMPALPLDPRTTQGLANVLTLWGVPAAGVASEAAVLGQGRDLYHRLGCIACHGALESPAVVLGSEFLSRETPASSFGDLNGKWAPKELSGFLQHPDARMPRLDLSASEADLLATYLLSRFAPAPEAPQAEVQIPDTLKLCAACHEVFDLESRPQSRKTLAELDPARGCLDPKDMATPRYSLSDEDRAALRLGLAAVKLASGAPAPLDAAERTYQKLGCASCHARDGRGGVAEELRPYFVATDERVDIGDEGRIPPDLSGVGFKLTTSWLGQVLLHAGRARPYLAARMPQFGEENVGALAHDLARREGVVPESDASEPVATDERVQSGRALMGRGALGCISCHLFKDAPAGGTPGPRLDQFAERLRYEWYAAYMPDPVRFKPGTKMPAFQTKGLSTVKSILAGDFHAQNEAMWCYFTLGGSMPPPPDLELGGHRLQIVVGERPIVLRAFLADVGARGIAVGMPSGLHFAFDAGSARLADAWKGDFLDASGAWAGRGGNELGGLGERVWVAPPGPLLALQGDATRAQFAGYELDAAGLPTFLWTLGKADVRETIRTSLLPKPKLRRELAITGLRPGSRLLLASGRGVDPLELHGALLGRREGELGALDVQATEVSFALEVLP
jgi:mono/diheme cytochrome c family protein